MNLISTASPYASLFMDAISYAKANHISDIHVEPTADGVLLRMRMNGDLQDWKKLPLDYRQSFIQEVKRLSQISIAISNKPQDARLSLPHLKLALRVNSTPMLYGEKIVLRLLDLETTFDFSTSNLDPLCVSEIVKATQYKNGVMIFSGPTGSGKTRTLYTILNSLEKQKKNIVTLEDPIEYTFERINQIEINEKNISFSDGLRAILRQDPDVILVGEIRDSETADLCFKAASTGHLVLTSLHANSATKVIDRLLNLGVEKYMIESNLRFSAAQRLVKKLCPHCSLPHEGDEFLKTTNHNGCDHCNQGVIGRLPILEYLTREELNFNSPLTPKESLQEATLKLARQGLVDATEVFYAD